MDVLLLAMKTRNREGFLATLTVFRMSLHSLSHPRMADRGSSAARLDLDTPEADPTGDWGRPADLHNLDVQWYFLLDSLAAQDAIDRTLS